MTNFPEGRLAFSTLTSPNWNFEQVLAGAQKYGYQGIELRVLDGQLVDLNLSVAERSRVKRLTDAAGIAIACVDSSIKIASGGEPDHVARELIGHLQLAHEWESSLVRIFPGVWPTGHTQQQVIAAMTDILERALPTAATLGVRIVLETHDTFARSILVSELLAHVTHPFFGVIWDVYQPHTNGETPDQVFSYLGDRIFHTHIKDARSIPGATPEQSSWELVPLGAGDIPVQSIIDQLLTRHYTGWFSVEWPTLWQPDLAGPEIVLPQHADVLRSWLESAQTK